ncbi:MAG: phosphopyruvate hydratase [Ruminococcus sp.]|nr:phosphopyruvate hydratase [Ruminococcus sp.]
MRIKEVYAREILDSRGNPTIRTTITLYDNTISSASVPSGASTGKFEASELRDNDKNRYGGKGVLMAISNVNNVIAPQICSCEFSQKELDSTLKAMDGTDNLKSLGANAVLSVSLAFARASAKANGQPLFQYLGNGAKLPVPMLNILNGGAHAANNLDIQEFMIMPVGFTKFSNALEASVSVYHNLGELLRQKGLSSTVGDEGGYAPTLKDEREAIELILDAIRLSGYNTEKDFKLALDMAASEWRAKSGYFLPKKKTQLTSDELIEYVEKLAADYPIISVEDPLGEEDYEGFKKLTQKLGDKLQIVGDDLFVTNKSRLQDGIKEGYANAILVKVNQIGTLTDALDAIHTAKGAAYKTIISHRSGETADTFISDLAVAINAGQIKTGAPCRSERVEKYNRLLKIEEILSPFSFYGDLF